MSDLVSVNIAGWLACATFLVASIYQGAKLWDRLTGRSRPTSIADQPITVQPAKEFVLKTECSGHMKNIQGEMLRQDRDIQRIDDDVKRVDKKVDTLRAEIVVNGETRKNFMVGLIEDKHKESQQQIEAVRRELSGKIDDNAEQFGQALRDMPGQVISVLKQTGAINGRSH